MRTSAAHPQEPRPDLAPLDEPGEPVATGDVGEDPVDRVLARQGRLARPAERVANLGEAEADLVLDAHGRAAEERGLAAAPRAGARAPRRLRVAAGGEHRVAGRRGLPGAALARRRIEGPAADRLIDLLGRVAEVRPEDRLVDAPVLEAVDRVQVLAADDPAAAARAPGHVAADPHRRRAAERGLEVVAEVARAAHEEALAGKRGRRRVPPRLVLERPRLVEGDPPGRAADRVLDRPPGRVLAEDRGADVIAPEAAVHPVLGRHQVVGDEGAVGRLAVPVPGHEDPVGPPAARALQVDAVPGREDDALVLAVDDGARARVHAGAAGEEHPPVGLAREAAGVGHLAGRVTGAGVGRLADAPAADPRARPVTPPGGRHEARNARAHSRAGAQARRAAAHLGHVDRHRRAHPRRRPEGAGRPGRAPVRRRRRGRAARPSRPPRPQPPAAARRTPRRRRPARSRRTARSRR